MAKTLLDDIIESIKGIDGRLVNQSGTTKQMIADLNYKVVAPAKSAADSAVSAADAAVASAQVTSDAVSAIASATAEAKQGANEAMSRAKSAWDVATGAKEAVTDFDPLLKSAQSDAGKALTQIADTASALSDAKTAFGSDVATAKQLANTAQTTADSAVAVASDARSNATVAIQTASGASLTAINAQGDATIAKQTASEATVQASNAESDFAQLSIRANKIEANVANNSGAIASVQQTASGLTTTVADIKANGGGVNLVSGTTEDIVVDDTANTGTQGWCWYAVPINADLQVGDKITVSVENVTITGKGDLSKWGATLYSTDLSEMRANNYEVNAGKNAQVTITVTSMNDPNKQTALLIYSGRVSDTEGKKAVFHHIKVERGSFATPWSPAPEDLQNQFTQIKQSIDGVATTINDPKTGLNATYQTAAGNANTISSVKGDVTQLQSTANGLTSRVGNLESKTDKQQTTIDQNKNAITLKADQTTVNTLKGNVDQNTSTLKTQADQIQSKVSASDVTGMLNGYATQNYAQSLVTQTADRWNMNLTKLQTDVNAIKTTGGGVNLAIGTDQEYTMGFGIPNTVWQDGYAYLKLPTTLTYSHIEVLPQDPYSFYYNLTPGQEYTQTIWLETDATIKDLSAAEITWFTIGVGHDPQQATLINLGENKYKLCSTYMWPSKSDNNVRLFDTEGLDGAFDLSTGTYLKFGKLELEEGTVSHTWSPAPSDMATVTSVTNLSATVDGIKSTVATKADQSTVTQLSNAIQSKVSSSDYTSTISQLSNDINLRVKSADLISQINQEAGGNTLIQVSNGKGSLILDAGNTIITGKAFIPSAAIANLTADQVQAGTLSGSTVHAGDNSGNAIDMGVLSDNYVGLHAYANNGNHTYIDLNGIHNYGASYDTRIQQGKITTNYLSVNGGGMIDFRDSNGTGMIAEGSMLAFDVRNSSVGYLSYNGAPLADWPSGSVGNELQIRYGESLAIAANSDTNSRALFSTVNTQIGYQQAGSTSPDVNLTGLWVNNSDRYVRLGTWNSNNTWSRAEFSSDGVNINYAGLSLGLKDNVIHMYMDGNYSATAIQLTVDGWAWINGYCEAMGHTQHSTLSTKTRIEEANPDHMLDLVNNTELTTFAFKSEVAEGVEVRHIGPIIDDINDVAQYRTPAEFIAPTKTARDDDNMIGALFGAVQALTKRIKKLEDKLNG